MSDSTLLEYIIKTLSCLDAKIENLRRQNETLEQIAQTLFKHWFIDFEFPNADGKPYKSSGGAMFASAIGDIPKSWHIACLNEYVNVINGYSYKGTELAESDTALINLKNFDSRSVESDMRLSQKWTHYSCKKRDFSLISLSS